MPLPVEVKVIARKSGGTAFSPMLLKEMGFEIPKPEVILEKSGIATGIATHAQNQQAPMEAESGARPRIQATASSNTENANTENMQTSKPANASSTKNRNRNPWGLICLDARKWEEYSIDVPPDMITEAAVGIPVFIPVVDDKKNGKTCFTTKLAFETNPTTDELIIVGIGEHGYVVKKEVLGEIVKRCQIQSTTVKLNSPVPLVDLNCAKSLLTKNNVAYNIVFNKIIVDGEYSPCCDKSQMPPSMCDIAVRKLIQAYNALSTLKGVLKYARLPPGCDDKCADAIATNHPLYVFNRCIPGVILNKGDIDVDCYFDALLSGKGFEKCGGYSTVVCYCDDGSIAFRVIGRVWVEPDTKKFREKLVKGLSKIFKVDEKKAEKLLDAIIRAARGKEIDTGAAEIVAKASGDKPPCDVAGIYIGLNNALSEAFDYVYEYAHVDLSDIPGCKLVDTIPPWGGFFVYNCNGKVTYGYMPFVAPQTKPTFTIKAHTVIKSIGYTIAGSTSTIAVANNSDAYNYYYHTLGQRLYDLLCTGLKKLWEHARKSGSGEPSGQRNGSGGKDGSSSAGSRGSGGKHGGSRGGEQRDNVKCHEECRPVGRNTVTTTCGEGCIEKCDIVTYECVRICEENGRVVSRRVYRKQVRENCVRKTGKIIVPRQPPRPGECREICREECRVLRREFIETYCGPGCLDRCEVDVLECRRMCNKCGVVVTSPPYTKRVTRNCTRVQQRVPGGSGNNVIVPRSPPQQPQPRIPPQPPSGGRVPRQPPGQPVQCHVETVTCWNEPSVEDGWYVLYRVCKKREVCNGRVTREWTERSIINRMPYVAHQYNPGGGIRIL